MIITKTSFTLFALKIEHNYVIYPKLDNMTTSITREYLNTLKDKSFTMEEKQQKALGYLVDPIYHNVISTARAGYFTKVSHRIDKSFYVEETPITPDQKAVIEELTRLFPDCDIKVFTKKVLDANHEMSQETHVEINW